MTKSRSRVTKAPPKLSSSRARRSGSLMPGKAVPARTVSLAKPERPSSPDPPAPFSPLTIGSPSPIKSIDRPIVLFWCRSVSHAPEPLGLSSTRIGHGVQRKLHRDRIAGDGSKKGTSGLVRLLLPLLPVARCTEWDLRPRRELLLGQSERPANDLQPRCLPHAIHVSIGKRLKRQDRRAPPRGAVPRSSCQACSSHVWFSSMPTVINRCSAPSWPSMRVGHRVARIPSRQAVTSALSRLGYDAIILSFDKPSSRFSNSTSTGAASPATPAVRRGSPGLER